MQNLQTGAVATARVCWEGETRARAAGVVPGEDSTLFVRALHGGIRDDDNAPMALPKN